MVASNDEGTRRWFSVGGGFWRGVCVVFKGVYISLFWNWFFVDSGAMEKRVDVDFLRAKPVEYPSAYRRALERYELQKKAAAMLRLVAERLLKTKMGPLLQCPRLSADEVDEVRVARIAEFVLEEVSEGSDEDGFDGVLPDWSFEALPDGESVREFVARRYEDSEEEED